MSQEGSVIGVITENRQRIKQTQNFKSFIKNLNDIIHLPLTYLGGHSFRRMRANNFKRYPRNKKLLYRLGVFPIIDHYYDPLFNPKQIKHSLRKDRFLPSINLNIKEQLELLSRFNYNKELINIPEEKTAPNKYYYNNYSFLSGDGEYLYNIVRTFKPKKIIEIGSGYSTLMACKAIEKNEKEAKNYQCKVICVEPFEHPWLEELDVEVNRSLVEDLPLSFFESLEANDILFIDSSHMIKPQGDVLFLFLHVLPILKPGVIVHIHDIFTPKDYLDDWILEKNRFWNEQYLLEAFLSFNDQYQIIGALNFLRHFYYNELCMACPVMKSQIERGIDREPGSFWMRRV
ncbi:MAG: class I SAM-dependent methyltransferase [Bacteroidetes bacterium]|nr:class I SAM-dependent methyltransferase [Bacteroidota bacterium]